MKFLFPTLVLAGVASAMQTNETTSPPDPVANVAVEPVVLTIPLKIAQNLRAKEFLLPSSDANLGVTLQFQCEDLGDTIQHGKKCTLYRTPGTLDAHYTGVGVYRPPGFGGPIIQFWRRGADSWVDAPDKCGTANIQEPGGRWYRPREGITVKGLSKNRRRLVTDTCPDTVSHRRVLNKLRKWP